MSARDREVDAKFIFKCANIGREMSITLTTSWPDPEVKPDANVVAESLYNQMISVGCPGLPTSMVADYSFLGVAAAVGTSSGEDDLGNHFGVQVGTIASGAMPANCAILIRKNTGRGGRKNRGRFYVPPMYPSELQIDAAGNIDPAYVGFLQAKWTAFFDRLVTIGTVPLLKHQSVTGVSTPITSFTVQSQIATQRRRIR